MEKSPWLVRTLWRTEHDATERFNHRTRMTQVLIQAGFVRRITTVPCPNGPGTEKPTEYKMTRSVALLGSVLLFSVGAHAQQISSKAPPLSPQETVNSMEIQSGYRMVPVLSLIHI